MYSRPQGWEKQRARWLVFKCAQKKIGPAACLACLKQVPRCRERFMYLRMKNVGRQTCTYVSPREREREEGRREMSEAAGTKKNMAARRYATAGAGLKASARTAHEAHISLVRTLHAREQAAFQNRKAGQDG